MKNYLIGLFSILIIVIIYLIFFSQSSLFTSFKLKKEINEKKEVLNSLQEKSGELQKNIKKLKSNDPEYLDELARDKHDMSEPDEIIIFNNK
jgi:cell division protein FtsB